MNIIKYLPKDLKKYCYKFLSKLKYPNYIPYFPHKIDNQYKIINIKNHQISENKNKIYYNINNIIFKGYINNDNIYFMLINNSELYKIKKIISNNKTFKFIYILNSKDILFSIIYKLSKYDNIKNISFNSWYLNSKYT